MQFVYLRNMESISIPSHLFIALIVSPTIAGILILLDLPPMLFQHFELYFQKMYSLSGKVDSETTKSKLELGDEYGLHIHSQ